MDSLQSYLVIAAILFSMGIYVSNIVCPVSIKTLAKKLTAMPSVLPINGKAIQWEDLPIFFPKRMSITNDRSGKNKLSKARVVK